jgi:RNA polymerase sigma-70 factor (ECF subfamily)
MPDPAPKNPVEQAYLQHRSAVYRFLLRRTRDHHDAEELTQRVFVDAAAALRDPNTQPRSVIAWLFAVADRRFVDEVRRRTTARRSMHLAASPDEAVDGAHSVQVDAALKRSLAKLPEEQRKVVIMKVIQGRAFAEIAEETGVSVDACKMRLSRAVARIRADLTEEGLGPE